MKSAGESREKRPPNPQDLGQEEEQGRIRDGAQRRQHVNPLLRVSLRCSFRRAFAHGLTLERDLIRVMDEAVEDGIGQGGTPNGVMPVLDRQLSCAMR